MRSHLFRAVKAVLATALAVAGASAFGQAPFPRLKGNNANTGRNADPLNSNPGQAVLRWFQPYSRATSYPVELDNTDVQNQYLGAYAAAPYDRLPIVPNLLVDPTSVNGTADEVQTTDAFRPFGYVTGSPRFRPQAATYNSNTEWVASPSSGQATGAVTPYNWLYSPYKTAPAVAQQLRSPDYVLTRCTASRVGDDPTLAANPTKRRYFEWRFFGAASGPRNYALYVNLPLGTTTLNTPLFPQQYYVFEITYGGNQRVIDVVDSYAAGNGQVRLGGGGLLNNATFPFDGTNPVVVRLYNTVPRDTDGHLLYNGTRTEIQPNNPALDTPEEVDEYDSNRRVVYADYAVAQPSLGRYDATPIMTGPVVPADSTSSRVVAALNVSETVSAGIDPLTRTRGEVASYDYNLVPGLNVNGIFNQLTPNRRWTYSPPANANEVDRDDEGADVTVGTGWTRQTDASFLNGSYLQAATVTDPANGTVTSYQPTLNDGTYDIFVYLPGNTATTQFGTKIQYRVTEASNKLATPAPVTTTYTVDQSQNRGWVRLGTRRFQSRVAGELPLQALKVEVSNYSTNAADAGTFAYADGVRFVGDASTAIRSTPVYTRAFVRDASNNLVERSVVIVADETGRIRCLDAVGRTDGTTDVYWTYPTTPRTNVTDPNLTEGIDGTTSTVAQMPSGFDLSTALVQRINGTDFLYIGSTNGRVYCIDMAGRGDYNVTNRIPGTTRRVWSFPNDFPSTAQASSLGPISGSVTYGLANGLPTIYVPAGVGRVYALDALPGDSVVQANRVTTVRWVYPALNQPTIGSIKATPLYEFGSIYVGGGKGIFYRLNADSGIPIAQFPRQSDINTGQAPYLTAGFTAGAASATSALLGGTQADTIFAADDNGYAFGLRASDLRPLWNTKVGDSARGSLGFTVLRTEGRRTIPFGTLLPLENQPTVVMPTRSGRILGLFALTTRLTSLGNRAFYSFNTNGNDGTAVASAATGGDYLFYCDSVGFLYGLSELGVGGAFDPGVVPPGSRDLGDDDPAGDIFRGAKLRFITREAYQNLRLPVGTAGHPRFNQTANTAQPRELLPSVARPAPASGTDAFEWGETVYAIVYDYPHLNRERSRSRGTPPPVVYFTFSVGGEAARSIPVASAQFESPGTSPPNQADNSIPNDGYAVVAFTFQGGGPNAVPPGNATLTATLSTQALSATRTVENVSLDPAKTTLPFVLANPIAVYMSPVDQQGADPTPFSLNTKKTYGMGASTDPTDAQNIVNGSPDVTDAVVPSVREDRMITSAGVGTHGARNKARFWVADRSLMGLIRPDGLGLDNVRVNISPLAWQGGSSTIYKPFDPSLFPNFEDLPTQLPNVSVDYPDVKQDAISVVKEPDGRAENPLFNSISLTGGRLADGSFLTDDATETQIRNRALQWSPVDVDLDIPRYQPPNQAKLNGTGTTITSSSSADSADPRFYQKDSSGFGKPDQGYIGRFAIYVDSTQSGTLDESAREAFRAFSVSTAVNIDERLRVITPQIDPTSNDGLVPLGSLAAGTGYTLNSGSVYAAAGTTFSPYNSIYGSLFQPLSVVNEGNVNMLDIRLAKRSSLTGPVLPWELTSNSVDPLAWLDGSMDMWSNFDYVFSPRNRNNTSNNRQVIQKSRVGDTVGTAMKVNPTPRLNANLPVGVSVSNDVAANLEPKVAVTVPIGFPVGSYSSKLRVIENWFADSTRSNEVLDPIGKNIETFTEPTFDIRFNVRETRLTNAPTPRTEAQIDANQVPAAGSAQTYQNIQPAAMRDPFGSLIVAWTSNRPVATNPGVPAGPTPEGQWRIFFAGLDNAGGFGTTGYNPPNNTGVSVIRQMANATTSPANNQGANSLRDLDFWLPQNGSWFKKPSALEGGYPAPNTNASALFGTTVVPESARYGSPSFPSQGRNFPLNPYTPTQAFGSGFMAFVGEARASDGTTLSRVFLTRVRTNDSADIDVDAPVPQLAVPGEALSRKGHPVVVQTGENAAIVLFPATSGNATTIQYAYYSNGAWTGPLPLPFGAGFSSVESIAGTIRAYQNNMAAPLLEVSFTGRLKGASASDTYLGRLPLVADANGYRLVEDNGALGFSVWLKPTLINQEPVTNLGSGLYRSNGVDWDRTLNILPRLLTGDTVSDLVVDSTRYYDADTGRISYDTTLGGQIVLDPSLGTLRLTGGSPGRNSKVILTYAPRFRRVSDGTGATSDANIQFDRRTASDTTYWRRASGAILNPNNQADLSAARLDRMVVAYTRGGGQGQAARPFMRTLRLGVTLPTPIYTDAQGKVQQVDINGLSGPYQIDPANGRIYVTSVDEGKIISIRYVGIVPGSGAASPTQNIKNLGVGLVEETREAQIPIEQAVNETGLTLTLDPFDPISTSVADRRPSLMWLFWTSTRAGSPDLFFQSYAPRIAPIPLGG
ncbi:hypothetical protein BH11ARM2_BH11ARM2_10130 [soil metagenome]